MLNINKLKCSLIIKLLISVNITLPDLFICLPVAKFYSEYFLQNDVKKRR